MQQNKSSEIIEPHLSTLGSVLELAGSKERYVTTERGKLFCRFYGKGEPLIVIHGGPCLSQDYLLPLARLAEKNTVIFYDQQGCGASFGLINKASINLQAFVDDLDSIKGGFGYSKISILGHSWGGFLAMAYAIEHQQCINKLILLNTMPGSSDEFYLFNKEVERRMVPYQQEVNILKESKEFAAGDPKYVEKYYRLYFKTYCYNPQKADLLNLYMSPEASLGGFKVFEIFEQDLFPSYNIHPQLKLISIPTLIIHGDSDPSAPSTARKIHEEIDGSHYIEIKNCGHFPYVESPDEFFSVLKNFLQ